MPTIWTIGHSKRAVSLPDGSLISATSPFSWNTPGRARLWLGLFQGAVDLVDGKDRRRDRSGLDAGERFRPQAGAACRLLLREPQAHAVSDDVAGETCSHIGGCGIVFPGRPER